MPVVPALWRLRQEELKFETSLSSIFYEILILLHVVLLLCIILHSVMYTRFLFI